MTISGLCIDMDGVLLDTERLALRCWQQAAGEAGFHLSHDLFARVIGRNVQDTRDIFRSSLGDSFDFDAIRMRRRAIGAELIAQHGMPIKEGAEALLKFAKVHQLSCAIVTSTESEEAHLRLKSSNLPYEHCILVGGESAKRGKPAPDLYLEAAARMSQTASHCVAIEDSIPGLQAAAAAGMRAILVPDLVTPDQDAMKRAFKVCPTLNEALVILEDLHA